MRIRYDENGRNVPGLCEIYEMFILDIANLRKNEPEPEKNYQSKKYEKEA